MRRTVSGFAMTPLFGARSRVSTCCHRLDAVPNWHRSRSIAALSAEANLKPLRVEAIYQRRGFGFLRRFSRA